jgi:hypothetical protein
MAEAVQRTMSNAEHNSHRVQQREALGLLHIPCQDPVLVELQVYVAQLARHCSPNQLLQDQAPPPGLKHLSSSTTKRRRRAQGAMQADSPRWQNVATAADNVSRQSWNCQL